MTLEATVSKHDILCKKDVAILCRVEVRTIERWMQRGQLKFLRLPGGHVRFRRCDVLEVLNVEGSLTPHSDPSLG